MEKSSEADVIKALKCISQEPNPIECDECAFGGRGYCPKVTIAEKTLNLIFTYKNTNNALEGLNKAKEAEIERLKNQKCLYAFDGEFKDCIKGDCFYRKKEDEVKSEAIEEFAERLKEIYKDYDPNVGAVCKPVLYKDIDNLVKEMAEGGAE